MVPRTAGVVLFCWLCGGCHAFDASLLQEDAGADASTPADAGPDARSDGGPSCSPRRPPARPGAEDGDGPELLFALRELELVQGEQWRTLGYDRDGLCSDGTAATVECLPPAMGTPESDGEDGIDNAFGHRFSTAFLVVLDEDLQMQLRAEADRGNRALLLRIRGWNGMDDDPVVDVAIAASAAVAPSSGGPCPAAPSGGAEAPLWDGTDCAWANTAEFTAGDPESPLISDTGAFVSGRTLVTAIRDRASLVLPGTGLAMELQLTDAVLTARISADGSSLEDVTLAGRWGRVDLLGALDQLGICAGSMSYMLLEGSLDETLDIRAMPGTGGSEVQCDALSTALRWRGTPVTWAGLAPAEPLAEPCP